MGRMHRPVHCLVKSCVCVYTLYTLSKIQILPQECGNLEVTSAHKRLSPSLSAPERSPHLLESDIECAKRQQTRSSEIEMTLLPVRAEFKAAPSPAAPVLQVSEHEHLGDLKKCSLGRTFALWQNCGCPSQHCKAGSSQGEEAFV